MIKFYEFFLTNFIYIPSTPSSYLLRTKSTVQLKNRRGGVKKFFSQQVFREILEIRGDKAYSPLRSLRLCEKLKTTSLSCLQHFDVIPVISAGIPSYALHTCL